MKTKPKLNLEHSSMLFGLMFVCMVVVVASIIVSKQLIGSIKFTNRVLDKSQVANDTLAQNIAVLPELKTNFAQLETSGPAPDKVLRGLPINTNFPGLATLIEQLSAVANVRLTTIIIVENQDASTPKTIVDSPDPAATTDPSSTDGTTTTGVTPPAVPKGPQEVNFSIQLNGNYNDLIKFIASTETAIRPLIIKSISFNGAGEELSVNMEVKTFYQEPILLNTPQTEVVQ